MSILRFAFSGGVTLANVQGHVPGGAAISPTSVDQIRKDRHETELDDSLGVRSCACWIKSRAPQRGDSIKYDNHVCVTLNEPPRPLNVILTGLP